MTLKLHGASVSLGIFLTNFRVFYPGVHLGDWDGMYLFAGPYVVLRCYEDETSTHLPTEYLVDNGPYTGFLMDPVSKIIQERQVTEPGGYIGVILDDVHGEHNRCRTNGCLVVYCPDLSEQAFIVTKTMPELRIECSPLCGTK